MSQFMKVGALVALLALMGAGCASDSGRFTQNGSNQGGKEVSQPSTPNRMYSAFPGVLPAEELQGRTATISTSKGDISFEFYGDTAPKAASNFIQLARDGYYDGLTFHRRVEGFVIQGGDPSGNGTGGPGYRFEDELNDSYKYDRGIVAMANAGPNTNGSQFFIMLADYPLPKSYTIFGRVTSGMDVVDQIAIGDVMTRVTIE